MKKLLTLFALAFNLCLYAQPGTLDLSFNPGIGPNDYVQAIAMQSDGKIIIGGYFTTYGGTARSRIARLNIDGTLDTTFNTGIGVNDGLYTTGLQSDGKIIIGGRFIYNTTTLRNHIARLNTDGSLDTTFNPGTGITGQANITDVQSTALQSDGKIIIVGNFTACNGTTRNNIARLNTDGSLDTVFNPGTGTDNYIHATAIQSDGKIIIGGNFTTYNDTARSRIARLNSDGSLDSTFNPGTGTEGYIHVTAIQSDGKIIIGGGFTTYNGAARSCIARLNTDGTLDTTFNPGTGANSALTSIAIQSDGKIVIVGYFYSYNGTARNKIARLNIDGSLDTTFNPGSGAGGTQPYLHATALQTDGKIIIGGAFTSYNGTVRVFVARVLGGAIPCTTSAHYTLYPDTAIAGNWWAVNQATSTNPLSYSWAWGDGNFSTGATPSHIYVVPGNYNICLTVTDSTGCTDTYCDSSTYVFKTENTIITINCVFSLPTGIIDFGMRNSEFGLRPNPANEFVTVSVDESLIGSALTITDVTGRVIINEKLKMINIRLSLDGLSSGVYLVSVANEKGKMTKKLVKQ